MVLPSVYYEINPPISAGNSQSELLGSWLSGGLASFRWMIACFWLAMFIVPTGYVLASYLFHIGRPDRFLEYLYSRFTMGLTYRTLASSGTILAGSAVVIVGFLLKYLSSALDIILDVDNYLRTAPPQDTPRARITERYLVLLNFLHSRPDSEGWNYDRIIIIAHSLGSLISADLLRYLARGRCPALTKYAFGNSKRIPMLFFSMGDPLRQLLNRFFPVLYGWTRPIPDGAGVPPEPAAPAEIAADGGRKIVGIPTKATPNAAELGVEAWINLYRSGDYVGRSVWLDNWCVRADSERPSDGHSAPRVFSKLPPDCAELCIGLGAHTHYWDRTAPDVAQLLDHLISG